MNFNFGYVYIINYEIKGYVYIYIGNISLNFFFFPEMSVSGCLTLNSWMKHRIVVRIALASMDHLTTTSPGHHQHLPPPEVKK